MSDEPATDDVLSSDKLTLVAAKKIISEQQKQIDELRSIIEELQGKNPTRRLGVEAWGHPRVEAWGHPLYKYHRTGWKEGQNNQSWKAFASIWTMEFDPDLGVAMMSIVAEDIAGPEVVGTADDDSGDGSGGGDW